MSYGTGPFASFGFGLPISASSAERGTAVSSRSIDAQGRLVQSGDEAGSFAGMSDTRQRVLILCALAEREPVKQGPDFVAATRARLRTALAPLAAKPNPAIKLLDVVVESRPNGSKKTVRFIDLQSGQADSVEI